MARNTDIVVMGTERVQAMFFGVERRAKKVNPAISAITRDFRRIMVKQFDSEGSYLGAPWQNLAENTIERKDREGLDNRILHATLTMRKEFTQGRGGYRIISFGEFHIGSGRIPAPFHQSGTSRVPQRVIFQFTPGISRRWTKAVMAYVVNGVMRFEGGDR
jgi:hypothetical protein